MINTLIIGFFIVLGMAGLFTFKNGLTDFAYIAVNNWKQFGFIVVCITAGILIGVLQNPTQMHVNLDLPTISQPEETLVKTRITSCKNFVTAKLENDKEYTPPKMYLSDTLGIGKQSYWDRCANLFGTNYWKHDITIQGENGGKALCKAYHDQSYRSSKVDSWCSTVFASSLKS